MTDCGTGAPAEAAIDEKIDRILDGADRMFLATSVDGNSSGASVFYARDGRDLLFFTFNPSRKAEQIRVNPRVQAVVWPRGEEGIRGVQIHGECRRIRDPGEQRLAHDKILEVTDAFRALMDDPYLERNGVVGYYRVRPTVAKYVDFHADPPFAWREYPENQVGAWRAMARAGASRLRLWWRAVRAPFFTATFVPVVLGAVIARRDLAAAGLAGAWRWEIFWLALCGALLAHAGANLANDYGDHETRNDERNDVPSPFTGGSRVIQAGLLAPWKVLLAALACFAATVAVGLHLNVRAAGAALAPTPLLWAGIGGCALGLAYTLGPFRLSYRGLGEAAIGLGFGPVMVLGAHYVLTAGALDEWRWGAPLAASVPVALFVVLIVWVNQFQDAPADARAGKRTWVVRVAEREGREFRYERAFAVHRLLNVAAFAAIAMLGVLGLAGSRLGTPYAFLALATAPVFLYADRAGRAWLADWNRRERGSSDDRRRLFYALLQVNALTIAVHLATGVLLIVAYLL